MMSVLGIIVEVIDGRSLSLYLNLVNPLSVHDLGDRQHRNDLSKNL
jgi:hypothetical protein